MCIGYLVVSQVIFKLTRLCHCFEQAKQWKSWKFEVLLYVDDKRDASNCPTKKRGLGKPKVFFAFDQHVSGVRSAGTTWGHHGSSFCDNHMIVA